MYARAHALVAPISSKTAPRSQVIKDRVKAVTTREVVKIRWRFGFQRSSGNQYCVITSRQTKASRGSVVSIFSPKQLRVMCSVSQSTSKVQSGLQAGYIDHEVVCGEVVQNVPFCLVAKGQKAGQGHGHAGNHRYEG